MWVLLVLALVASSTICVNAQGSFTVRLVAAKAGTTSTTLDVNHPCSTNFVAPGVGGCPAAPNTQSCVGVCPVLNTCGAAGTGNCGVANGVQPVWTTNGAVAAAAAPGDTPTLAGNYLFWSNTGSIVVQPTIALPAAATAFPATDTYTLAIAPSIATGGVVASGQIPELPNAGQPGVTAAVSPFVITPVSWSQADCPTGTPAATPVCKPKVVNIEAKTNGFAIFQPTTPIVADPLFLAPSVYSGRSVALNWQVYCTGCNLGTCNSAAGPGFGPPTAGAAGSIGLCLDPSMPTQIIPRSKPLAITVPGLGGITPARYPGPPLVKAGFDAFAGTPYDLEVNTPSQPFTVSALTVGADGNPNPNLTPGSGVAVTVTPQLWDLGTNTATPPRVPTPVPGPNGGSYTFSPVAFTITAANPAQSFRLVSFPNTNPYQDPANAVTTACAGGGNNCKFYAVYFPDPNGVGPGGLATTSSPNPVWELGYFFINIKAATVTIPNFPPVNRQFFVSPAVVAGPNTLPNAVTTLSYNYQMRMSRNPIAISSTPLLITTAVISRGFTGTPLLLSGSSTYQFVFNGTTTVLPFTVTTQGFPTVTGTSFDIEFAVQPLNPFLTSLDVSGLGDSCLGLGTTCTLCNDLASPASNCHPNRNRILRGLTIRENPIETRINFPSPGNGGINQVAPYVGEPFYFDFVWTPPLEQGITIRVGASEVTSTNTGFVAVNTAYQLPVSSGQMSARAGPFYPLPPTNLDPTFESFNLVYSFSLDTTGDYRWFGFAIVSGGAVQRNANTMSVTVYRRYLVSTSLARTTDGTLSVNLASTGVPSPPICVSLNLPLATYPNAPSDFTLTATPIGFVAAAGTVAAGRWEGLIFSPPFLTFTASIQTVCMTVQFDTKFRLTTNALGDSAAGPWSWDVAWQLGGGLKEQFVNPWYCTAPVAATGTTYTGSCAGARIVNFPTQFLLVRNPIQMWILEGATGAVTAGGQGSGLVATNWFVGESRTLVVTTDWPTPFGVTYNLYAPGLTFSVYNNSCAPSSGTGSPAAQATQGSCSFAPLTGVVSPYQQTHYWTVTASFSGANAIVPGWTKAGASDPDNFKTGIGMEVSGQDSALYNLPPNIDVSIRIRRVYIDQWPAAGLTTTVGGPISFSIRLGQPVLRGLTVTPVVSNSNGVITLGNSAALSFNQNATFLPGQPSSLAISGTATLLSGWRAGAVQPWRVRFLLSGPDQYLFWVTNPTGVPALENTVTVYHRPAPVITPLDSLTAAGTLYPMVWYGPLKVSVDTPLGQFEQLTVNFGSSDWEFSFNGAIVTSITFTPGERFEVFSARPLRAGTTRIFFTLSGLDAWKYSSPVMYPIPPSSVTGVAGTVVGYVNFAQASATVQRYALTDNFVTVTLVGTTALPAGVTLSVGQSVSDAGGQLSATAVIVGIVAGTPMQLQIGGQAGAIANTLGNVLLTFGGVAPAGPSYLTVTTGPTLAVGTALSGAGLIANTKVLSVVGPNLYTITVQAAALGTPAAPLSFTAAGSAAPSATTAATTSDTVGYPNAVSDGLFPVQGRHTYIVARRPIAVTAQQENGQGAGVTNPRVIIGTTHYGQVRVEYPTAGLTITPVVRGANGASVTFSPSTISLDNTTVGTVFPFSFVVNSINRFVSNTANAGNTGDPQTSLAATGDSIDVTFSLGGSEAALHGTVATMTINVQRRSFVWDVQGGSGVGNVAGGATNAASDPPTGLSNLGSQIFNNHFVFGRRSQVFTIVVATPPTGTVTLRIAHPLLCFSAPRPVPCVAGQSVAATFTFGPTDVAKSFTFVPIGLAPTADWVQQIEIVVGGSDAQFYEYNQLWSALQNIIVLPALVWSPIPVTYIDQDVTGVSVQLANTGAATLFPYNDTSSFSLHMYSPAIGGISFEPSALAFSPSNPASQSYEIHHVYPNVVDAAIGIAHPNSAHATGAASDSYNIGWSIKFIGTNTFIPITRSVVPQEAQRVVVARYQIIPLFPKVLANVWQPASFNLTRAPIAHLTLVPHQPDRDGINSQSTKPGTSGSSLSAAHYGSVVAAGRIVTDPPAVVFNPGQVVSNFQVMAIGYNPSQTYYRLDWQLSGHKDDRVCYVESGDPSPAGSGPYTFSTYHVASAAALWATGLAWISLLVMLF